MNSLDKAYGVTMMFSLFVGLASTIVGSWVLAHGHTPESARNVRANQLGAAAAGFGCPRAVSTYLMGAVLTTGGFDYLALMLFVIVRNSHAHVWTTKLFIVAGQPHHTIETISQ
jgi:Co/Zn/Cd efflux system component